MNQLHTTMVESQINPNYELRKILLVYRGTTVLNNQLYQFESNSVLINLYPTTLVIIVS